MANDRQNRAGGEAARKLGSTLGGFMIQAGGMTADMQRKEAKAAIRNEATNGLSNMRGTIAMARTPEVNSATSQFFISTVDNKGLDHKGMTPDDFGYAVFGKVIDGKTDGAGPSSYISPVCFACGRSGLQ